MTGAVLIPSFVTVEDAIDYVEKFGEVVSVSLQRGADGMIRGNAIVLTVVDGDFAIDIPAEVVE